MDTGIQHREGQDTGCAAVLQLPDVESVDAPVRSGRSLFISDFLPPSGPANTRDVVLCEECGEALLPVGRVAPPVLRGVSPRQTASSRATDEEAPRRTAGAGTSG